VFVSFLQIELIKSQGTIYIHSDGSVEGTDKIQPHGDVFTLSGDVFGEIQVQKSNIVLDGAGYTLLGNGEETSKGIDLSNNRGSDPSRPEVSNVTLKNIGIVNFSVGVGNVNTNTNTIIGCYIADCFTGINVVGRPNNVLIKNNTFVNNVNPISIAYSGDVHVITENSFINGNFIIVWLSPQPDVDKNYWSDYNGTDADGDGVGDTPYVYGGNAESKYLDEHPLMEPVPVIPEFPSWTPLLILIVAVSLFILIYRSNLYEQNHRVDNY